jgi:hypothetical protein
MSDDNSSLILQTLLDLKKGQGEIAGKLDASLEAHKIRFAALEETDKRQWYATALVFPVVTALHVIGSKVGLIK